MLSNHSPLLFLGCLCVNGRDITGHHSLAHAVAQIQRKGNMYSTMSEGYTLRTFSRLSNHIVTTTNGMSGKSCIDMIRYGENSHAFEHFSTEYHLTSEHLNSANYEIWNSTSLCGRDNYTLVHLQMSEWPCWSNYSSGLSGSDWGRVSWLNFIGWISNRQLCSLNRVHQF